MHGYDHLFKSENIGHAQVQFVTYMNCISSGIFLLLDPHRYKSLSVQNVVRLCQKRLGFCSFKITI